MQLCERAFLRAWISARVNYARSCFVVVHFCARIVFRVVTFCARDSCARDIFACVLSTRVQFCTRGFLRAWYFARVDSVHVQLIARAYFTRVFLPARVFRACDFARVQKARAKTHAREIHARN